ncbi:interferon-induced very large GTPase 1-like [Gigaspora margarita]|uniref:Interferon-induced very large GTPase 1-like n=1 Tax=Gigaspora margarita TaxID=4874 RepID=A0A8H3XF71_GIGMA|nr:interferon-induced very large GTPase 1-like [Gigaspora margarita]
MNREDCSDICNPNSIDISFHATSENRSHPPLAISEVYYDESGSSILNDTVKESFYKLKNIDNPWLDWTSINISKILGNNTEDFLSENDFSSMAKLDKFTCHADIFYTSYCENKIETLRDKIHFKTSEDTQCYQTYSEILIAIQNFDNEQKNIGDTKPILVLSYFADINKKNNIKYMREFACQADVYFKSLLISLAQKDNEIKNI